METGPSAGLTAMISVPGAATARAAAPIFSVMATDVFGLTTRMRMGRILYHSLAGIRALTPLPGLQHQDDDQGGEDHQERHCAGQRAQRVNVRLGDRGGEALQLQRQGVDGADGLARASEFVPRQGKAEQANADHRRQDDRQHYMAERLPWRGAEIARGFFEPAVEPVE